MIVLVLILDSILTEHIIHVLEVFLTPKKSDLTTAQHVTAFDRALK